MTPNDPLAYIKSYPFKYYSMDRLTLSFARLRLNALEIEEDLALLTMPNRNSMTPAELEEAEFKLCGEFIDRRVELLMLIDLFQKEKTARSLATKKAKEARAQRKDEKALKQALISSILGESLGGK